MMLDEAEALALETFGSAVRLETRNGIRCVMKGEERLGAGPSWRAALKQAVLRVAQVDSPEELAEKVRQHELAQQAARVIAQRRLLLVAAVASSATALVVAISALAVAVLR